MRVSASSMGQMPTVECGFQLPSQKLSGVLRYKDSLFTFLEKDGISWHNNPAEWAIRPIAKQRAISSSFTALAIEDYLVFLGIRQTCRSQNKSFFKFLFSGETDLDQFEVRKRKRQTPK